MSLRACKKRKYKEIEDNCQGYHKKHESIYNTFYGEINESEPIYMIKSRNIVDGVNIYTSEIKYENGKYRKNYNHPWVFVNEYEYILGESLYFSKKVTIDIHLKRKFKLHWRALNWRNF